MDDITNERARCRVALDSRSYGCRRADGLHPKGYAVPEGCGVCSERHYALERFLAATDPAQPQLDRSRIVHSQRDLNRYVWKFTARPPVPEPPALPRADAVDSPPVSDYSLPSNQQDGPDTQERQFTL